LRTRTSFRSKVTVYGTLSVMRGMGDYLVREGVWEEIRCRTLTYDLRTALRRRRVTGDG
jgi:hypothetical protein